MGTIQRYSVGGLALARGLKQTGRKGVRVEPGAKLQGPGTYDLHPRSAIRRGTGVFVGDGATLFLGEGASIGSGGKVNATVGVHIGRGTRISWNCQILDSDFHAIKSVDGDSLPMSSAVHIGNDVLVGTGTIILKGTTIGHDSVVAAGSVVTGGAFEPFSLIAGNPARLVRTIGGWIP